MSLFLLDWMSIECMSTVSCWVRGCEGVFPLSSKAFEKPSLVSKVNGVSVAKGKSPGAKIDENV